MIKSFSCKDTQVLYEGNRPLRFRSIQTVAERKLTQLDAAVTLDFMRAPPGNRLEALRGDRKGQWSIRINAQWRICFRFESGDVFDVEIVDYH
ncbi:MAG: type II toxin-antitoxin system RelE/ParE family toxin [Gallionellaceae bacterium]